MEQTPLWTIPVGDTELMVMPYAVCVVAAIACGMLLMWLTSRGKLKNGTVSTLGILILPLGLVFAKLFHVAGDWYWYEAAGLDSILRLWEGGYALWGAVLGGTLAVLIAARITKQPCAALFDACAAPAALVIAVCRFAEYPFSGQGIGMGLDPDSVFCRFPFAVVNEWEEWYWAIFMLEGIIAVIILVALLVSGRKNGDKARMFLILYSAAQIICESLRRDQYLVWSFVRVSQLTAALVLAGLIIAALIRRNRIDRKDWLRIVLFVLGICVVIGMEFAKDKLPVLPIWSCYAIMAAASAVMGYSAWYLVLKHRRG